MGVNGDDVDDPDDDDDFVMGCTARAPPLSYPSLLLFRLCLLLYLPLLLPLLFLLVLPSPSSFSYIPRPQRPPVRTLAMGEMEEGGEKKTRVKITKIRQADTVRNQDCET